MNLSICFFFFLNSNKRSNQTLSLLFVHWKIYNYNLQFRVNANFTHLKSNELFELKVKNCNRCSRNGPHLGIIDFRDQFNSFCW